MADIEKLDAYIRQLDKEILGPDGTGRLPDVALCAAHAHRCVTGVAESTSLQAWLMKLLI